MTNLTKGQWETIRTNARKPFLMFGKPDIVIMDGEDITSTVKDIGYDEMLYRYARAFVNFHYKYFTVSRINGVVKLRFETLKIEALTQLDEEPE